MLPLDRQRLKVIGTRHDRMWFASIFDGATRLVWPVVFNSKTDMDEALQILGPVMHNGQEVRLQPATCDAGSAFARACRAKKIKLDQIDGVELVNLVQFTDPFKDV